MDTDAAFVATLIREAQLCGACLAKNTGLTRPRVGEVLNALRANLTVVSETAQCVGCLQQTIVHRAP